MDVMVDTLRNLHRPRSKQCLKQCLVFNSDGSRWGGKATNSGRLVCLEETCEQEGMVMRVKARIRTISAEEYDATLHTTPERCRPFFAAIGDLRTGRQLIDDSANQPASSFLALRHSGEGGTSSSSFLALRQNARGRHQLDSLTAHMRQAVWDAIDHRTATKPTRDGRCAAGPGYAQTLVGALPQRTNATPAQDAKVKDDSWKAAGECSGSAADRTGMWSMPHEGHDHDNEGGDRAGWVPMSELGHVTDETAAIRGASRTPRLLSSFEGERDTEWIES
eukprot:CAMPEP_0202856500 /NCGR_PEP_ID=MMETSP1389-20130828/92069_1 /ASSEMBLY_ACC=CAM_ASM_000865 /TAXON_ID=302021 /ORGANISM="Rhodomonas sp., Strain CCMP768" /LENGTH=277 /DNA_ID=CAMNT_0049535159 /DNA_START=1 /DNA_END=832 /DNA_ORIENTATION=-